MEKFEIHNYLALVFDAVSEANRHFAAAEPWALKKTNRPAWAQCFIARLKLCAGGNLDTAGGPEGAAKLLDYLGVDPAHRDFSYLQTSALRRHRAARTIGRFPRLEAMGQASDVSPNWLLATGLGRCG